MNAPKSEIETLIGRIIAGELSPKEGWKIVKLQKDWYVKMHSEQSWHQYIGDKFEDMAYKLISNRIGELKQQQIIPDTIEVLKQEQIKKNEIVYRKIVVKYNDYLLLPDVDMCFIDQDFVNRWNTSIIGIASCKTSLRERIAQSCYWKLKFLSSDVTKHIKVYLVTADHDGDYAISNRREKYNGKSRNRIISEYELDGIFILRDDFKAEWESKKVKNYEKLFDELTKIFRKY